MSYLDKIKEVTGGKVTSNEGLIEEILSLADELKSIASELKFQANNAKPDPDKHAYDLMTNVEKEIFRAEHLLAKSKKSIFP